MKVPLSSFFNAFKISFTVSVLLILIRNNEILLVRLNSIFKLKPEIMENTFDLMEEWRIR